MTRRAALLTLTLTIMAAFILAAVANLAAQEITPPPEVSRYEDEALQLEYPTDWTLETTEYGLRLFDLSSGARILLTRSEDVFRLFEPELNFISTESSAALSEDFVLGVLAAYSVLADSFASATAIDATGRAPVGVTRSAEVDDRRVITMTGQSIDTIATLTENWVVLGVLPAGELSTWQETVIAVAESLQER